MSRTAEKVQERWTRTTIQATFDSSSLSSLSRSNPGPVSIDLPLLHLGWTFVLSFTLERENRRPISGAYYYHHAATYTGKWTPYELTFRRYDTAVPWGNTSMCAQLFLATEPSSASDCPVSDDPLSLVNNPASISDDCLPVPDSNNSTLLDTMEFNLAHTHSRKRLNSSSLSTLPSKISLIVKISGCPFPTGFFHLTSGGIGQAEAQTWLAKKNGDRLLSRSLTSGKTYDLKFLSCPSYPASGNNGKHLETYVSLSVLEKHFNPPSAQLKETWTSALAASTHHENAGSMMEIPCPDGCEYELDSDFDEDEAAPTFESSASIPSDGRDSITLGGRESDGKTEGSKTSFSSLERDGASDISSFDSLPEEFIKDLEEPPYHSSKAGADHEPAILIKFAAHRTWRAFLWYCYTGDLEFGHLKSQTDLWVRHLHTVENGPPSCSPKSMYRLADLIGDGELKAKALEAIRERMTEANVLDEVFSVFTSKYPDVQKVQIDVLMSHRRSPKVKKAFLSKMANFGDMYHAQPALEAFYDRLTGM